MGYNKQKWARINLAVKPHELDRLDREAEARSLSRAALVRLAILGLFRKLSRASK